MDVAAAAAAAAAAAPAAAAAAGAAEDAANGVAVSYVCSILPPKSAGVHITPATAQEVAVALMVITNTMPAEYVFRLTAADGTAAFVATADFGYGAAAQPRVWYDIFACARRLFCIQAVYTHGQLRGAPALLRVYVKAGVLAATMTSRLTGRTVLDNEQALSNLLAACMGRVIVEPAASLGLARDALLDASSPAARPSGIPTSSAARSGGGRPMVAAHRALAPEQRAAAQALADAVAVGASRSSPRMSVRGDLPVFGDIAFDLTSWALQTGPYADGVVADWRPRAGLVLASRGCGRRRTLAALAQALSSAPAPLPSRLSQYPAPGLVVIVCAEAAVRKWTADMDELGMFAPLVIRARDDYDALTYRVAERGGVVLVTPEALAHAQPLARAAAEAVREAMHTDAVFGSGLLVYRAAPPKLNYARSARLHVSSFGARFPDAVVPLPFLRTRCVIVDDTLNLDACARFTAPASQARATLCHATSLPTEWTWLVAASVGPPPTHVPQQAIELCEEVLGVPETARYVDEEGRMDHVLPDVWRLVHEPAAGLLHRLTIPKPLLRKVTIVPVLVNPTDAEIAFVDAVRRMTAAAASASAAGMDPPLTGLSVEQRSAMLLCAPPAPGADGACALHVALARTSTLTLDAARASIAAHFGQRGHLRGTLAQRVMGTAAAGGCEAAHVERALDPATREAACQICFTDPPTRISLCGHALCGSCADMLRRPEARAGTVPCPCCRAPLSAYDWLALREGSNSNSSNSSSSTGRSGAAAADGGVPEPSKITAMRTALREAFGRRRAKRRSAAYTAWVVAPAQASRAIAEQLPSSVAGDGFAVVDLTGREDAADALDEPLADEDARTGRHRVFVLTFEQLSAWCASRPIGEGVEAVVFACPAPSTRAYYEMVAASGRRSSALQLHVLVAAGLEDVRPALQSLLEPSEEPVRRIIRRTRPL